MEQCTLGMQDHVVGSDHESDPPESEEESIEEEEFLGDDTSMPLRARMSLPRRSMHVSGREPLVNFSDVEPL